MQKKELIGGKYDRVTGADGVEYLVRPKGDESKIKVYDNGGKTLDRYTVLIRNYEMGGFDVYTMSSDPLSPQGINQYNHTADLINTIRIAETSGKRIDYELLPLDVKRAIWGRRL